MVDREPRRRREFHISPKSTHEWLQDAPIRNFDTLRQIAGDMLTNVRELEGRVDWSEISRQIKGSRNTHMYGKEAVAIMVAPTVGSVARHMGWDMHSPEVVYMSGFHPYWILGKELSVMRGNIEDYEQGSRRYKDEEKGREIIKKERATVARLATFRSRLGESLNEFTRQQIPQGEVYVGILQNIPYLTGSKLARSQRTKGLDLLKQGEIDAAAAILVQQKSSS